MERLYLYAGLLALLLGLGTAAAARLRTRRILSRLDAMLQSAQDGTFRERSFDESRLSALEGRMARYLAENAVTARAAAAEKDRIQALISDISHQTKTPVANLLPYAQLLSEQPLPEGCRQYADALASQAEKLQFLVDALVKTSRLEAGIIAVRPVRQPVRTLLEQAAAPVRPKAGEKGMAIFLPETGAEARFDRKWTAEALGNLLDNAVKYAPPHTGITVTVQSYELFCRIDVADLGPGIAPEEQNRIFQRFYRAPAAAETEGVGIGLYLAREIAAAQSGYLRVRSKPGQGSVFSLFLPRA